LGKYALKLKEKCEELVRELKKEVRIKAVYYLKILSVINLYKKSL
jgi:hypothetical protein